MVNQCRMHLRRHRRINLLSLDESLHQQTSLYFASREPTPEESATRHEVSSAITRAVARLPDRLRVPYTLHTLSELPVAEVAQKMGLSVAATKSRIFRARCALESRLCVSYGPSRGAA